MTWLRSTHADELDKRAQEFMSRHDVSYLTALRAILPEVKRMSKYPAPTAAAEVDVRAQRYVTQHQGVSYKEAYDAVLAADPGLRTAYAAPPRLVRMATTDPRSQPVTPVTAADEREILDWVLRALNANMAGSLPGELGALAVEADRFAKVGMPIEEAARRAMGLFPHLVNMSKLLLVDIRRNAPEKPVTQQAQANPAGYEVHARAVKLQQENPRLDYREAVGAALSEDPALKQRYAGVQR